MRSVLIVDDEEDILVALRMLLKHVAPDVTVHTADSGPNGLQVLQRIHIDLVVSDYRMPGMDGLEFLQRAQRFAPEARVAILSAYTPNTEMLRRAKEIGVEAFLSKAIDVEELVRALRNLVRSPTLVAAPAVGFFRSPAPS